MITRFASFTDAKFVQYLNESGTYFVMCHDGAMPDTAESQEPLCTNIKKGLQAHVGCRSCAERIRKVNLRAMISWFIGNQYNVALINELRCADSKVSYSIALPHMARSNTVPGNDRDSRVLTTAERKRLWYFLWHRSFPQRAN
jgi:hypothetical protein